MVRVFKSINSSTSLADKPCYNQPPIYTNLTLFTSSLASVPPPLPPLLPLPSIHSPWPTSPTKTAAAAASGRQPRDKKPRHAAPSPKKPAAWHKIATTAPILVAPSKKGVVLETKKRAVKEDAAEQWIVESLYSVSPPPSSVPMPTFSLITGRKAVACAVEVVDGDGVDACATDELRRLLRL